MGLVRNKNAAPRQIKRRCGFGSAKSGFNPVAPRRSTCADLPRCPRVQNIAADSPRVGLSRSADDSSAVCASTSAVYAASTVARAVCAATAIRTAAVRAATSAVYAASAVARAVCAATLFCAATAVRASTPAVCAPASAVYAASTVARAVCAAALPRHARRADRQS